MIVVKTGLKSLPENCADCWYFNGACMCNLVGGTIRNDDGEIIQPEIKAVDGSIIPAVKGRYKFCPLVEVEE